MRVGRTIRVFEDEKRRETLTNTDENRRVVISFYYPIDKEWKKERQALYTDLYSPREDKFIEIFKNVVILNNETEKESYLKNIKTNIYNDAPISKEKKVYPVILQSTGLGAPRDYMTFNIEKLVEEGFVVFTIEHIYDSVLTVLPNGEIIVPPTEELTQEEKNNLIDIRVKDILFILDTIEKLNKEDSVIKDKLDLQKIGTIGHSLGGAAVFKASQRDSRIKATVLFDGALQLFNLSQGLEENKRLSTPVLNLRRSTYNYEASMKMFIDYLKDNSDAEAFKKQVLLYDDVLRKSEIEQRELYRYLSGYKSFIKINDTTHMTFTDFPIIQGEASSVQKAQKVINDLTVRFFNEFLCSKQGDYSHFIKNDESITLIYEQY